MTLSATKQVSRSAKWAKRNVIAALVWPAGATLPERAHPSLLRSLQDCDVVRDSVTLALESGDGPIDRV